ncbi:MAG: hypothetical protein OQK12_12595 [Motiliproteus sp.]|nr:hypothetical protein [Motiliproteus sp.]MCW9051610.1 hypothetical protein [Motiliproteus sp.]
MRKVGSWFFVISSLLSFQVLGGETWRANIVDQLLLKEGVVVYELKGAGQEFYVDLGRQTGVQVGDVIAVLEPSIELFHPVTKKKVQQSGEVKAILGITRVMEELSKVVILEGEGVVVGDPVQRFSGIPARLWDKTSLNDDLYQFLRRKLPDLEWKGVISSQKFDLDNAGMTFVRDMKGLKVFYGEDWEVRTFNNPLSVSASEALAPTQLAIPRAVQNQRTSFKYISELPGQVRQADYLDYQGKRWLVSESQEKLTLSVIEQGGVRVVDTLDVPFGNESLALHWWHPDPTQQPLLAMSTWDGEEVDGMLFRLEQNGLVPVKLNLPYIFGSFDLDGDGRNETLLGQLFDKESFYGRYIRKITLSGASLTEVDVPINLPYGFSVLGSVIADLDGDQLLEIAQIRDRNLVIYDTSGDELYVHPRSVGSGLSSLSYEVIPGRELSPVVRVYLDDGPLVVRLEENDIPMIAVSEAKYSEFSAFGIENSARESRLSLIRFENGRFKSSTLTDFIENPLLLLTDHFEHLLVIASVSKQRNASNSQIMKVKRR